MQVYQEQSRYILFNSDGSYNSKKGDDSVIGICLGQSIKQLYDTNNAFNILNSVQNLKPTCNDFSLLSRADGSVALAFSSFISDNEDGNSGLSVKFYNLPSCGIISDAAGQAMASAKAYSALQMSYKACNNVAQNNVSYSVIDSGGLESSVCKVILNTMHAAPTCVDIALTSIINKSAALVFSSFVSYSEDSVSSLKVKVLSLPSCGAVVNASKSMVVLGQAYGLSELTYMACDSSISSEFSYLAVDSNGSESAKCKVGVVVMPDYCLVLKGGGVGSSTCKIQNNYYGKYLYDNCSSIKNSDFDIVEDEDGYFRFGSGNDKFMISRIKPDGFLIKKVGAGYFTANDATSKFSYEDQPIKKSYWDINGNCDFITNKDYNKFPLQEMSKRSECNTKVNLERVLLITKPFLSSGDSVQISLSCGDNISKSYGNFTADNAVITFDGSVECEDLYNVYISVAVNNNQKYTMQITPYLYNSYPQYSKVSYIYKEQDLNSGEIEVISAWGSATAACAAAANALFKLDANGNLDAACTAFINGSGGGGGGIFGTTIFSSKASAAIKATCNAYLKATANAKATFDFTASCSANLEASGGITLKKTCISSDASSAIDATGNGFLNSLFTNGFDFSSYSSSNGEVCAFVNDIAKYVVEVSYERNNEPYCVIPEDLLFLTGKTVGISGFNSKGNGTSSIALESSIFSQSFSFNNKANENVGDFGCRGVSIPCVDKFKVRIKEGNSEKVNEFNCNSAGYKMVGTHNVSFSSYDQDNYYDFVSAASIPSCYNMINMINIGAVELENWILIAAGCVIGEFLV